MEYIQSIKHHETGNRHRFNVQAAQRKSGKAKKQEESVKRELERINRAATGNFSDPTGDRKGQGKQDSRQVKNESSVSQADIQVFSDQVLGQYSVGNAVYLDGRMHQDLLVVGRSCEAFNGDDWEAALIEGESSLGRLDREFLVYFSESGSRTTLRGEDIRVVAPSAPAENAWSTVSVSYVEKDPEDAYSTFNPFGGDYKGFSVAEVCEDVGGAVSPGAGPKPVFKKRRKKRQ